MQNQPWDRQKGEGPGAYEAARLYFDLGPERNIREVGQRLGKSAVQMSKWSARWKWVARSEAFDTHEAQVEQQARDKERAKKARQWERRREDDRETNWQLASSLRVVTAQKLAEIQRTIQAALAANGPVLFDPKDVRTLAETIERASKIAGQAIRPEYLKGEDAPAADGSEISGDAEMAHEALKAMERLALARKGAA